MNRLANLVIALVISACLVAGVGLVYRQLLRNQAGATASMQAIDAIRASERIAAEWGAEVGRVKNQPDADFDSLKVYIPRLAAQREAIVTARGRMGELPNEIRNGIRGYLNRLRAKQELIERFKTDHAVIRNSQDFLLNDPEGSKALLRNARGGGRTMAVDAAGLMLEELEQFIRTPTRAWRQRTGQTLDALLEVSDGTPDAVKVEEIAAHVDVLLDRYKLAEDRFEEAVSNRDIRSAAAVLGARIDAHHQARRISVDYLNYTLYAIAGLAFVYWTSLVMRFFRGRRRGRREEEAPAPVAGAEAPAAEEAVAGRVYSGMLRGAPPMAPASVAAATGAGAEAIPPRPVAEAIPPRPVAEAIPPRPVAEAIPPRPVTEAIPPRPVTEAIPPRPVAEAIPPRPVTEAIPPRPVTEAIPPRPVTEAIPPQPVTEAIPPRPVTEAIPPQPVTEAIPPRPVAEAPAVDTGVAAEAPAGPAPEPYAPPIRGGGIGLTTHALVEAVFGKLAEVADELDRAAEAGEALRSPVAGERSEEALAALLGRLAGARWGAYRLAAQARGVLEGTKAEPDRQRIDLRDALKSLLDTLDEARRGRITAVLLPGAVADVDLRAFEAAMERILGHALEAAARHPEGAGHVELTLTTREGRHCISCIDHGPGPPTPAAGGAPAWRDTLDLDVARRLVTAQGGEFEAATYPPYGSRIRIWIPPCNGSPTRRDVEPRSQRHDRYTISR